jgi:hypothetical protein
LSSSSLEEEGKEGGDEVLLQAVAWLEEESDLPFTISEAGRGTASPEAVDPGDDDPREERCISNS